MEDLRENLIQQAVDCLQSTTSTLSQQASFLESKGLTSLEVAEAVKRSNMHFNTSNSQSGWLWNVLYPVAVIGAGCAAYVISRALDEVLLI
jgi:hypothetical protein